MARFDGCLPTVTLPDRDRGGRYGDDVLPDRCSRGSGELHGHGDRIGKCGRLDRIGADRRDHRRFRDARPRARDRHVRGCSVARRRKGWPRLHRLQREQTPQYGLLRFDLASLPAGATVTDAKLRLSSYDGYATNGNVSQFAIFLADDTSAARLGIRGRRSARRCFPTFAPVHSTSGSIPASTEGSSAPSPRRIISPARTTTAVPPTMTQTVAQEAAGAGRSRCRSTIRLVPAATGCASTRARLQIQTFGRS